MTEYVKLACLVLLIVFVLYHATRLLYEVYWLDDPFVAHKRFTLTYIPSVLAALLLWECW